MKRLLLVFGLVLAMAIPALAADSTSLFNEKVLGTKIEKASGGGGVPVGTVIAWPSNSNPEDPENWLECNGQGISHTVYPELFAVVGGSVPDFRGLFLRGIGGNSAALGQNQGDAMSEHQHATAWWPMYGLNGNPSFGYMATRPPMGLYANVGGNGNNDAAGLGLSSQPYGAATATENRPVNKAVRYLIRAKP